MNPFLAYQNVAREHTEAAAKRLLNTYDMAIEANKQRNKEGVRYCLDFLRHTLDFQANPELAHNLLMIYRDCELALDETKHDAVGEILESVRGLWTARLKLEKLAVRAG